jgi:hypothetical protein
MAVWLATGSGGRCRRFSNAGPQGPLAAHRDAHSRRQPRQSIDPQLGRFANVVCGNGH